MRAERLLVDEIAPAADALRQQHIRHDRVGHPHEIDLMLAAYHRPNSTPPNKPALDCQTALKRIENMDWIGQIISRL